MSSKAEPMEVGTLVRVNLHDEWYGAIIESVNTEDRESNWYGVNLLEYTGQDKPGSLPHEVFNDSTYLDIGTDEYVQPTIHRAKTIVMRADFGELGSDTVSIGGGDTIESALDDTLKAFHDGRGIPFPETPEAVKHMTEGQTWRPTGGKIQYYMEFWEKR